MNKLPSATPPTAQFNLAELEVMIRRYERFGTLSWVLNIVLLGLSIYQFILVGWTIKIDAFFIIVNVLNVLSFYATYKVYDRLALYKLRHTYTLNNPA
jgi:hypothetical protein